jgi:hypothetical protein
MDFRQSCILRILSTVVLAFFLWTFGGLFDIAYAIKNSNSLSSTKNSKKEKKPEEKFQETLDEIEAVLNDKAIDKETKKSSLKLKKKEIESLDGEIQAQFTATEEKIKDLPDLPEVIQHRHRDFVKQYQDNLKGLKNNLDAIDKAKTDAELETEIEKTKEFLSKVKPPKKHTPLDPNKLPHRSPEKKEAKLEERKSGPEKLKLPGLRNKNAFINEELFTEDILFSDEDSPNFEPFMVASAGPLNNLFAP